MKAEYYEGVALVAIQKLKDNGKDCSIRSIMKNSGLHQTTILKAIIRLENKGRLKTIPADSPIRPNKYEILDTVTDYDKAAYHINVATKNKGEVRKRFLHDITQYKASQGEEKK